jgi:hypothetical protein
MSVRKLDGYGLCRDFGLASLYLARILRHIWLHPGESVTAFSLLLTLLSDTV